MEHKIKLLVGHTDDKGVHQDVVFSRRPTVGDMMLLDNDVRAASPTQYANLIVRRMITKFGELALPVADNVLLGLNSIDREDLASGADKFLETGRNDRIAEYLDGNVQRLRFGFEINDTNYSLVTFGELITGRDEVEADGKQLSGVSRECFLLGRQITKLTTDDGVASIDGPVELDKFKTLDGEDLNLLRIGAQMWRLSFRISRESLSGERDGGENADADALDGDDGNGGAGSADGKDQHVSNGSDGVAK